MTREAARTGNLAAIPFNSSNAMQGLPVRAYKAVNGRLGVKCRGSWKNIAAVQTVTPDSINRLWRLLTGSTSRSRYHRYADQDLQHPSRIRRLRDGAAIVRSPWSILSILLFTALL
ncbi:hypothetical protein AFLA_007377 [Aspergillus flavus NRRL3357]|nr:hypothetical protein AFLA_007377 [Aspergillus flavus NRRL3357]